MGRENVNKSDEKCWEILRNIFAQNPCQSVSGYGTIRVYVLQIFK